jgi:hypothetical protein
MGALQFEHEPVLEDLAERYRETAQQQFREQAGRQHQQTGGKKPQKKPSGRYKGRQQEHLLDRIALFFLRDFILRTFGPASWLSSSSLQIRHYNIRLIPATAWH